MLRPKHLCICSEAENMIERLFTRASRLKMFTARLLPVFLATILSALFCNVSYFRFSLLPPQPLIAQISLPTNFLPISRFIFNQEDSKRKTHPLSKKRFRGKSCILLSLLRALASHQCTPGSNPGVEAICELI